MPTLAEIAGAAFAAVREAIPDAIHDGILQSPDGGQVFNDITAEYDSTPGPAYAGRVLVESEKPVADIFPDYVASRSDQLVFLEGFGVVPGEGWTLTYGGDQKDVRASQDILGAGTTSYAVVR